MHANTSKIKVCFKYSHLDISGIASDFSEDITALHTAMYYPWWAPPNKPEPFHWTIHSSLSVEYAGHGLSVSSQDLAMKVLSNESTFSRMLSFWVS